MGYIIHFASVVRLVTRLIYLLPIYTSFKIYFIIFSNDLSLGHPAKHKGREELSSSSITERYLHFLDNLLFPLPSIFVLRESIRVNGQCVIEVFIYHCNCTSLHRTYVKEYTVRVEYTLKL